jgi:hypothetical protein
MVLNGSPRKSQATDCTHQRAYFSSKEDLLSHLNEVRRITNNKKLQLKDLKVEVSDENIRHIELDLNLQRETACKYIETVT